MAQYVGPGGTKLRSRADATLGLRSNGGSAICVLSLDWLFRKLGQNAGTGALSTSGLNSEILGKIYPL